FGVFLVGVGFGGRGGGFGVGMVGRYRKRKGA
ncbi:hypothetical protein FB33_2670, partial [Cutibacterium acnes]